MAGALVLATAAQAGTFYVATSGTPDGDGTRERPWPSVLHALSQVGGGHTIVVRPGVYRGPITIPREYAGTRQSPTILRSEVKWQAVVIGSEYHVISNGDGCDWLVVDGFEVMGGRYDGVKMNGNYNTVRNCWIHNNKAMGVAMHGKTGGLIENNLIEFNGSHIQFDHGVYASGESLTVRGNVVRHNASYGLHLYPSIKEARVENNLVYGQVRGRAAIIACPEGGGRNRIVHNTIVDREGVAVWNGNGEIIANNIIVAEGAALAFDAGTRDVAVDYNVVWPNSDGSGPHGVAGDPLFVESRRGVFWLRPDSPAIGRASPEHTTPMDFWGRPRPGGQPIDAGAFPFVPYFATDAARADWDHGWAYHRHGSSGGHAVDYWRPPPANTGTGALERRGE
jgi:parallel beta-helix repeat protein